MKYKLSSFSTCKIVNNYNMNTAPWLCWRLALNKQWQAVSSNLREFLMRGRSEAGERCFIFCLSRVMA